MFLTCPYIDQAITLTTPVFDEMGCYATAGYGLPAFCAFRHLARRAFCAPTMRLRATGDIARFLEAIETTFRPLTFAQRARWAAATRARPAADILPLRVDPLPFSAESAVLRLAS